MGFTRWALNLEQGDQYRKKTERISKRDAVEEHPADCKAQAFWCMGMGTMWAFTAVLDGYLKPAYLCSRHLALSFFPLILRKAGVALYYTRDRHLLSHKSQKVPRAQFYDPQLLVIMFKMVHGPFGQVSVHACKECRASPAASLHDLHHSTLRCRLGAVHTSSILFAPVSTPLRLSHDTAA